MAPTVEIHWGMWNTYPALTVGFPLFTLLMLIINTATGGAVNKALALSPTVEPLLDLLNRLLFFQVVHKGFFHWALNMMGLFTPMMLFERTHGTVYTGITLNLLAVFCGIPYYLLGKVFYKNAAVLGLLGYVFSFFTYYCWRESRVNRVARRYVVGSKEVEIPTAGLPVVILLLWTAISWVFDLQTSFPGHAIAVVLGYLLGMGHMAKLYPPSTAILWIESKVSKGIDQLAPLVTYYREEVSSGNRSVEYSPIFSFDLESSAAGPGQFVTESRVLGT